MIHPRAVLRLLVVAGALALASCGAGGPSGGNSGTGNDGASLQVVTVTPNVAVPLPAGLTQRFAASAYYSNGTGSDLDSDVTWSSSDTEVATVDSSGLVTAQSAGDATITATYGGVTSTGTTLAVTGAVLNSISLEANVGSLAKGLSTGLSVYGHYSDGSTTQITSGVTFSSGDTGLATVGTDGIVSSVATIISTVTITADYGGQEATVDLGVTTATLDSLTVTVGSGSIALGLTSQITVFGNYSDGTSIELTSGVSLNSNHTGIADVSASGVVSALGAGTATITASYGGKSNTVDVGVTAALLQSLTLQVTNGSLIAGLTSQVTVFGNYSDGTSAQLSSGVTFSSDNLSFATVTSLGVVTGIGAGTANVTASYGGKSASTGIAVSAPVLQSLSLAIDDLSLAAGLTTHLTVTAHYSDASTAVLTSGVGFNVETAGLGHVSVNSGGVVSALLATTGSVNITASYAGVQSSPVAFSVTSATLSSISVAAASGSLAAGLTTQLTVTGHYTDASTATLSTGVTFSSSLPAFATVTTGGLVSTLAMGSPVITASYGGLHDTATITVTNAVLDHITVVPTLLSISLGHSSQLTVTAFYSDASTANVTSSASYTATNNSLLSVSLGGLVIAILPGSTTFTATYGGKSAVSASVTSTLF